MNNTKKRVVKKDLPNKGKKFQVGGAGAFGLLGGANVVSAGKQILTAAKVVPNLASAGKQFLNSPHVNAVKGAFNLIKKVLTKSKNPTTKNTGTIRNAVKNKKNPFTAEEKKGAMNLLTKKSKPVNYSGPSPMHNTGAGGSSYPSGR